ncbi:MAG: undecaprenyl-diphosphate phosphatase, partial [Firmicutes bacterium]|nr:undecaprenyl-diphosphate phosphatase [Bacillota bacterium]
MEIWQAIVLGLIQGLTEFLPVSSSGHLLFFQEAVGIYDTYNTALLFDIFLHLATLLAVIIIFRKKIWELIRNPFCKTNYCLLIATAISCVIVVVFLLLDISMPIRALPFTFLITAAILVAVSFIKPEKIQPNYDGIGYRHGIAMGTIQGIAAIFPGISRSGSTIAAGMATGARR